MLYVCVRGVMDVVFSVCIVVVCPFQPSSSLS